MDGGDLFLIDKQSGEALVPLAWLGDAYREVGRAEAERDAERVLRLNAEDALRREMERGRWWWPKLRSRTL